MANRGPEFELITGGTDADAPSKGAVALNLVRRQNALEVRKGFGQMAQFDTFMSGWMQNTSAKETGYRKLLGSYLIKTSWGDRQIASLVAMTVHTGAVRSGNDGYATTASIFALVVYDVAGGAHWEEPLFRHTAENGGVSEIGFDMLKWHGAFETNNAANYASFIGAPEDTDDAKEAFFAEIDDILYFGNEELGVYAYLPVKIRQRRRRQLQTQYENALVGGYSDVASPPYSESCFVKRLTPAPPSASEGAAYTYTDKSTYPKPTIAAAVDNRLVLATGKTVWFADPGAPQSVKALNNAAVPTDEDITALAGLNGNVYAFTRGQVWLIELSPGPIVTLGRVVQVSNGVGCSGPNAITKTKGGLVWLDAKGAYSMTGVAQIQRISDPVDTFFTSELSNPLNTYFVTGGQALTDSLTDTMPRSFWRYSDDMVSAAYNEKLDAVLFSFSSQNAMLVFASGQWFVWSVESMAAETGAGAAKVGCLDNIKRPWVMADEDDIFVSCGIEAQALTAPVLGATYNTVDRSIAMLRYGRGGAVDRSVEDEDMRVGLGGYTKYNNPGGTSDFGFDGGWYFHEPIPIMPGEVFTGTPNVTVTTPAYWVPVELVLPYSSINSGTITAEAVRDLEVLILELTFDNTHWAPILYNNSTAEIRGLFPSERMASAIGAYGVLGGTFGAARDFRVYSGGSPSATGNVIKIKADASGGGWSAGAIFNIMPRARSRMFWIPMMRKTGAAVNNYQIGMGLTPYLAYVKDSRGGASTTCGVDVFVWNGAFMGSALRGGNSVAQPVDFAYKSGQIGMGDDARHKLRGSYMRVLSHGKASAADRVQPNWPVGIINTATASDFKGWVSQVIDLAPGSPDAAKGVSSILDVDSVRTRYMGANSVLSKKVFASGSSGDHVHYGTTGAGAITDVYLIDDEEVDVIATSDSAKGGKLTFMLWGMLRNKAEKFAVESIKAVVRAAGGRRRGGR